MAALRKLSAHSGASWRNLRAGAIAALLTPCVGVLACGSDRGPPERDGDDPSNVEEHDASVDASRADAAAFDADPGATIDAESEYSCLEHSSEIKTFVENHRACANDDDCVIVGDCSHANFQVVARSAEDAAKKLLFDGRCQYKDGPTYFARCRENACVAIKSRVWCGSKPQTECPTGMTRYEAGCGAQNPAGFRAGCNTPCNGQGDDGPCTTGYTCQQANIHPCPPGSGANTCDACIAEKWLCLPVAACQVELSLTFDGRSAVRVLDDEASELKLWLENRTDQTVTFSYELPCIGPALAGLADYDLWGACLAGACPAARERVEVTLAPRERKLYRSALVELKPSTCNPHGLAAGKYMPTFTLPYVQGANVCGPTGTLLIAGSNAP